MPCMKSFYKFKVESSAGEVKNEDVSPKNIWGGFKEQTTAHGIPHVDQARGRRLVALGKGTSGEGLSRLTLHLLLTHLFD